MILFSLAYNRWWAGGGGGCGRKKTLMDNCTKPIMSGFLKT